MKKIFYNLCLVLPGLTLACVLHAQGGRWQQLNGPSGANSVTIAAFDSTIYLTTTDEIFKRSTISSGWILIGSLPTPLGSSTFSLDIFYGRLCIVNANTGVVMSSDGGQTWFNGGWKGSCNDITLSGRNLYAIGWDTISQSSAIFRSEDTGITWTPIFEDSTLSFNHITGCLTGSKFYVSTNKGIYTNTQNDTELQRVIDSVPNFRHGGTVWNHVFEVDSSICIASAANRGVWYRTTNSGITWDSMANFSANVGFTMDSSGTLWSIAQGVMISKDSGKTWSTEIGNFNEATDAPISICVSSSNEVVMNGSQHIYKYDRAKTQWTFWDDSLRTATIISIMPLTENSMIVLGSNGIYRTTNGGNDWTLDSTDSPNFFPVNYSPNVWGLMRFLRDRKGNLYISNLGWILKYDFVSMIWKRLTSSVQNEDWQIPGVLAVDSSGNLYSDYSIKVDTSELLRSSDNGKSWSTLFKNGFSWNELTVDPQGRLLGCVTALHWPYDGWIIRSSDHGQTWDTLFGNMKGRWWPPDNPEHVCVTQSGRIIAAYSGSDSISNFTIIQSTDEGVSWQVVNVAITPLCFALDGDSTVYFSGYLNTQGYGSSDGIMESTDEGSTWHWISYFADTSFVPITVFPNHHVFAGSLHQGIFRYISSQNDAVLPLHQLIPPLSIYPNPVANILHVESNFNSIVITDLLGRMWPTIFVGAHDLDVSVLPQGIYYISDSLIRTKFVKE
jgi:photosystem II stability/assembly factor-like uncharacterized protein